MPTDLNRPMCRLLLLCLIAAVASHLALSQEPSARTVPSATQDAYAVYATAINGLFDDRAFRDRKLLIENQTVSFECGKNSCNRLDVGKGCSGMREPAQSPDLVAMQFRQTMTTLEPSTWDDFKQKNEHCSALQNDFPLKRDYLWMENSTKQAIIGKHPAADLTEEQQAAWSQYDKVFLSEPGFNSDRTQALLYLGVACHEQCSWFGYLLLGKVNGDWTALGHYTVAGH
jgi:hypothetical protein